jgi:tetratricopeptide (TPR) repeat protein
VSGGDETGDYVAPHGGSVAAPGNVTDSSITKTATQVVYEALRERPASPNNLPHLPDHFVGREYELDVLHTLLEGGDDAAISGVESLCDGGIGKSLLAMAYAYRHLEKYPGGVVYLRGDSPSLVADLALVAEDWGVPKGESPRETAGIFRQVLQDPTRPALLLVDNLDDLKSLTPEVRAVLPKHPCRCLATTRLRSIPGMRSLSLDNLREEDAVALLTRFRPDAEEHPTPVRRIVLGLERWALGVTLVGVYMSCRPAVTWEGYAAHLEDKGLLSLELLDEQVAVADGPTGNDMVRPDRYPHRVSALLDDVLSTLPPATQRLLEYAALLPRDLAPVPWLVALLEEDDVERRTPGPGETSVAASSVVELVEQRRLFRETGGADVLRTIAVHRLLADELTSRLHTTGAHEPRMRTVLAHATSRARYLFDHAIQDKEGRHELPVLQALLEELEDEGPFAKEVALLASETSGVLNALGDHAAARACSERAVPVGEATLGADDPKLAARYSNVAAVLKDEGKLEEARGYLERAIAIEESALPPGEPTLAESRPMKPPPRGNPYTTAEARGDAFVGRVDELDRLEAWLHGDAHNPYLIVASRRAGKSSLLHALRARADRHPDVRTTMIDLAQLATNATADTALSKLLHQVATDLGAPAPLSPPRADAMHTLDQISKLIANSERRVLVLVDEVATSLDPMRHTNAALQAEYDARASVGHVLRRLRLDLYERVRMVFATGSDRVNPTNPIEVGDLKDAWTIHLPYLSRDEVRAVCRRSDIRSGGPMQWTRDGFDTVFEQTRGMPYLVQILCKELFDTNAGDPVTRATIMDVVPHLPARGATGFRWIEDGLPATALLVARALAEGPTRDLGARLLDTLPSLARVDAFMVEDGVRALELWNIAGRHDEEWSHRVPLLGRWFAQLDRPSGDGKTRPKLDAQLALLDEEAASRFSQLDDIGAAEERAGLADVVALNPNHIYARRRAARVLRRMGRHAAAAHYAETPQVDATHQPKRDEQLRLLDRALLVEFDDTRLATTLRAVSVPSLAPHRDHLVKEVEERMAERITKDAEGLVDSDPLGALLALEPLDTLTHGWTDAHAELRRDLVTHVQDEAGRRLDDALKGVHRSAAAEFLSRLARVRHLLDEPLATNVLLHAFVAHTDNVAARLAVFDDLDNDALQWESRRYRVAIMGYLPTGAREEAATAALVTLGRAILDVRRQTHRRLVVHLVSVPKGEDVTHKILGWRSAREPSDGGVWAEVPVEDRVLTLAGLAAERARIDAIVEIGNLDAILEPDPAKSRKGLFDSFAPTRPWIPIPAFSGGSDARFARLDGHGVQGAQFALSMWLLRRLEHPPKRADDLAEHEVWRRVLFRAIRAALLSPDAPEPPKVTRAWLVTATVVVAAMGVWILWGQPTAREQGRRGLREQLVTPTVEALANGFGVEPPTEDERQRWSDEVWSSMSFPPVDGRFPEEMYEFTQIMVRGLPATGYVNNQRAQGRVNRNMKIVLVVPRDDSDYDELGPFSMGSGYTSYTARNDLPASTCMAITGKPLRHLEACSVTRTPEHNDAFCEPSVWTLQLLDEGTRGPRRPDLVACVSLYQGAEERPLESFRLPRRAYALPTNRVFQITTGRALPYTPVVIPSLSAGAGGFDKLSSVFDPMDYPPLPLVESAPSVTLGEVSLPPAAVATRIANFAADIWRQRAASGAPGAAAHVAFLEDGGFLDLSEGDGVRTHTLQDLPELSYLHHRRSLDPITPHRLHVLTYAPPEGDPPLAPSSGGLRVVGQVLPLELRTWLESPDAAWASVVSTQPKTEADVHDAFEQLTNHAEDHRLSHRPYRLTWLSLGAHEEITDQWTTAPGELSSTSPGVREALDIAHGTRFPRLYVDDVECSYTSTLAEPGVAARATCAVDEGSRGTWVLDLAFWGEQPADGVP